MAERTGKGLYIDERTPYQLLPGMDVFENPAILSPNNSTGVTELLNGAHLIRVVVETKNVFMKWGSTPSATAFTVKILSGTTHDFIPPDPTGSVSFIGDGGTALVTISKFKVS